MTWLKSPMTDSQSPDYFGYLVSYSGLFRLRTVFGSASGLREAPVLYVALCLEKQPQHWRDTPKVILREGTPGTDCREDAAAVVCVAASFGDAFLAALGQPIDKRPECEPHSD